MTEHKRFNVLLAFATMALFLAQPFTALAHKGATGIVKQRMDAMSEMGDAMGVMADMVKAKRPFDVQDIKTSISSLDQHSRMMLELFPNTDESRLGMKTEALPVIWDEWERFVALSKQLEERIEAFRAITETGIDEQTLRFEFKKTARACSGCHDDFRKPSE